MMSRTSLSKLENRGRLLTVIFVSPFLDVYHCVAATVVAGAAGLGILDSGKMSIMSFVPNSNARASSAKQFAGVLRVCQ
jgi:hypothetical protein